MAEGIGRKVGIGCCSAAAVLFVAAVMIGVISGKKAWIFFQTAAEEQTELITEVEQWEVSLDGAAVTPQSLSPKSVDGFQRKQQALDAEAPGFSLGASGLLDVYVTGGDEVRVWIAETDKIDMAAAIEKVKAQIDKRFTRKSKTSLLVNGKGRLSYSGSPPNEYGLMVNTRDYLYLVQSNDKSTDLQNFLIDYVEAGMQNAEVKLDDAAAATDLDGVDSQVKEVNDNDAEPQ